MGNFVDQSQFVLFFQVLSPFWVVLFYFTLIMLGISQALALFHSVIQVQILLVILLLVSNIAYYSDDDIGNAKLSFS